MQKLPIFKWKNHEKSKAKKIFFLIEVELTPQAKHNSQNMPKCLVFLQHVEEQERLKSHLYSLRYPLILLIHKR